MTSCARAACRRRSWSARPDRTTLDLNALTERGVTLVGRLVGIQDGEAQFSGSLRNHCAMADLKLRRLLDSIDRWVAENPAQSAAPLEGRMAGRLGRAICANAPRSPAAADARSDERPHRHDPLGDGLSTGSALAAGARVRSQGPPASRRRNRRRTGPLCARAQLHAQTQVELHPWRGGRRPRPRRASRGIPAQRRRADQRGARRAERPRVHRARLLHQSRCSRRP